MSSAVATLELAGLTTHVVGSGDGPCVALLHGFGAPGTDLVGLGEYLAAPGTRFVFPEAPLALGGIYGEGRAWWMIDLAGLEADLRSGRIRDRSNELPAGLVEARRRVTAWLDELTIQLGVPDSRLVLGGFSQGAMVTLDVVLHSPRALAGAILLSGTLLAADEWIPRMAARRGLPLFQSHGDADPLLPYDAAVRLRDELQKHGVAVEWHGFRGGHEIPPAVLRELAGFLKRFG